MEKITIELLNTNSIVQVEAYEKAVYYAFSRIIDSSLDLIWKIDRDNKRIRTGIDYHDQRIMIVRFGEDIIAGTAINLNMEKKLQLEHFGFLIDKSESGICEGLLLFSNQISIDNHLLLVDLREKLIDYLEGQKIRRVYSTCSQKRIRNYRFLGFKDIDSKKNGDDIEYLLMYDV